MIKVLIADDHAIVRQGLRQILSETTDIRLAGEAVDGPETLRLVRNQDYDVLVLDITMPGISGFDILKTLQQEQSDLPVLVLSIHSEDQYAVRCLRAGAAGYLTKESAPEELVKAIRQVANGGKYVSRDLAESLATSLSRATSRPLYESLSDREFQVLQLMGAGKTNKEIADTLSLSIKTISTYRARILDKLALETNADLIKYAIENRLTPSD